ncbi:hypothetical protein OROGR_029725 [Orobanche gracilis]
MEQWKNSSGSKRKENPQIGDEEGGHSEKRRRGKRKKKDKTQRYESEEADAEVEDQEKMEYDDGYNEEYNHTNDVEDREDVPQDIVAAVGLKESDAEDFIATTGLDDSDAEDNVT